MQRTTDLHKTSLLGMRRERLTDHGAAVSADLSELSSLTLPKVRLITYAWGRPHLEDLLNYALPSVLAPGNLPALSAVFDCVVVVVTEEAFFNDVRNSAAGRALQKTCLLKLVSLDDLIAQPWQYGMTITHSLFRGFDDLGPAMTQTYLLFLNADFVLADGCYARLIDHICKGERILLAPSYCAVAERVKPLLDDRRADFALSISAREMAAMIIENCHNTILSKTVNQRLMDYEHTDQFYWKVDQNTLIGHQLPMSLIGIQPEQVVSSVSTFWDWGMVYEFCPSKRLSAIVDSDEFLMMELRSALTYVEFIRLGRTAPKQIARRTTAYITQYQVDNAKFQLLLHSGELPSNLHVARQSLKQFVATVLANLPRKQIDHRNHRQWLYHKRHFRARLENRLRVDFTRRRKGELLIPGQKIASEQGAESVQTFAKRVSEIAHPYKNSRSALQRRLRELADRNPSVLVICDHDSYLLDALDFLPGVQTHLGPDLAVDGLNWWPKAAPRFDLCLIEVTGSRFNTLDIFDAAMPCMRQGGSSILMLWHNRLPVDLLSTATEIIKVITLRRLDFDIDYTLSRTSVLAARALRFAARPVDRFGLKYPLKLSAFVTGLSLAVAARLGQSLSSRKRPYVTRNCNSFVVDLDVSRPHTLMPPPPAHSARSRALLSRAPSDVDLYFNTNPEFTKWVVKSGALHEPFVVIDVGVLGGENPRWHFLREHLVVHGFDAIKEAIEELRLVNWDINWNRSYHWFAIGRDNGETEFFFDSAQPTRSSLGSDSGLQRRVVPTRSLDSLMAEHTVPQPDFLKVDVEGYELDVFAGAMQMLRGGVLGIEVETNFSRSPAYPTGHFNMIHNLLLEHGLKLFDLNFDRVMRPLYKAASKGRGSNDSTAGAGAPATFNVLFCRDMVAECDGTTFYERRPTAPTVDQVIKMMIIYELHGLSDVAVDTAVKFSKELKTRLDVETAIERLCR